MTASHCDRPPYNTGCRIPAYPIFEFGLPDGACACNSFAVYGGNGTGTRRPTFRDAMARPTVGDDETCASPAYMSTLERELLVGEKSMVDETSTATQRAQSYVQVLILSRCAVTNRQAEGVMCNLPNLVALVMVDSIAITPPLVLPAEAFTHPQHLSHLTHLWLINMGIEEIPPEFGSLSSALAVLAIRRNRLTTLPSQLGMLRSISLLSVSSNILVELPKQVGDLTSLVNLDMSDNALTALPAELGRS